jgi:hypothetical protein
MDLFGKEYEMDSRIYQDDEKIIFLNMATKLMHELTIMNFSQANLMLQFFLDNMRTNQFVRNINENLTEFKMDMGRNNYNLAVYNTQRLIDILKTNGKHSQR